MKFLVYAVLFTLLFSPPGLSNELEEVDLLAKEKIGAMIEILQDECLDKAERNARVISLLTPIFRFSQNGPVEPGTKILETTQPGKAEGIFRSFCETDPKFLFGEVGAVY